MTPMEIMARAIDQADFHNPIIEARAALAALDAAGYAVVPREPTEAMMDAAKPGFKEAIEAALRAQGEVSNNPRPLRDP